MLTLLAAAAILLGATPAPAPTPASDVVVIILDDFGFSEVPLCPSLAALSAQGVTFTRAYVRPTCSPTRYAIQSGQYPRRQETVALVGGSLVHQPGGIGDLAFNAHQAGQDRLPMRAILLPELLKPAFETTLVGKWHLGRHPLKGAEDVVQSGPFSQGFDAWYAGSPSVVAAKSPGQTGTFGYYRWNRVEEGDMGISVTYATDAQRDSFLAYWGLPHTLPRFCTLAWSAPHDPFDPPPGHVATGTTRGDYVQVVQSLDAALTAVLASIDLGTTYVFLISDNGTPDDAAPVPGYSGWWKGSLYEGGIHVPLIVAGPGIMGGATSSRLVQAEDLAATIAELVGVPITAGFLDSVSFANALGPWTGAPAREFIFQERYEVPASSAYPQPSTFDGVAIVESRYKLVRTVDDPTTPPSPPGPAGVWERLYDLQADPYEVLPLHPDMAGLQPGGKAFLQGILDRMNGHLATLPARAL